MSERIEIKEEKYRGIVCAFICEDNGTIFLEIKETGVKEKKLVRFNKYLKILRNISEKHVCK